jgi:hypothetical protein
MPVECVESLARQREHLRATFMQNTQVKLAAQFLEGLYAAQLDDFEAVWTGLGRSAGDCLAEAEKAVSREGSEVKACARPLKADQLRRELFVEKDWPLVFKDNEAPLNVTKDHVLSFCETYEIESTDLPGRNFDPCEVMHVVEAQDRLVVSICKVKFPNGPIVERQHQLLSANNDVNWFCAH